MSGTAGMVTDRLARRLAEAGDRIALVMPGRRGCRWTCAGLLAHAAGAAARLDGAIAAGTPVAIMRASGPAQIADVLGCLLAGALPCLLAPPNPRMAPEAFERRLHGLLGRVATGPGSALLLADAALAGFLQPIATRMGLRLIADAGAGPGDAAALLAAAAARPEPLAFLQHSSGTTGTPKGVVIDEGMLLAHADAYARVLRPGADDVIVSWLPLYHDMGYAACWWGALLWGVPLVQLDNFLWAADPALLLEAVHEHRGTLVWLPNFAFNHLARAVPAERSRQLDLSSVRRWISCSEPVLGSSIDRFLERFAGNGVDASRVVGCYGMAENVFAVSQPASGPARRLRVDRTALDGGRVVATDAGMGRELVSSGPPVPGVAVAVLIDGRPSAEPDRLGELALRSPFMLRAYHARPDETAAALVDGWYRTGDLGFLHDGEVHVVGRSKDLIIVGGRNLDPTEVEDVVAGVPGATPGRVGCLGLDSDEAGTQEVHVVVETERPAGEHSALIAAVKAAVFRDTGHAVRAVHCVEPRWLVKSSSGKIARGENRDRLLARLAGG